MLLLYRMISVLFILFYSIDFVTSALLPGHMNMTRNNNVINFQGKIVGGEVVQIETYPFAVQFLNMGRLCGGVIINSWSVVTVAHCLEFNNDIEQMVIQAGAKYTYDFTSDRYKVLSFVIHEKYNKEQAFSCDIALIFVRKPIEFGTRTKKAILVDHGRWMNEQQTNFIATGWGYTQHKGEVSNNGLQMARLRYIKKKKCSELLEGHKLTTEMFCLYGNGRRDTCQGDSGGGVLWNNMLVGLTSHGDGCATVGKPSVYTNLWFLRNWIIEHVDKFVERFCDDRFQTDKIVG